MKNKQKCSSLRSCTSYTYKTRPLSALLTWSYLLDSLLVFHSFPFEFLTHLPGVSKLGFIQITAASGCWQVLLQLPDGHLHLLQLRMILLSSDTRTLIIRGKHRLYIHLLERQSLIERYFRIVSMWSSCFVQRGDGSLLKQYFGGNWAVWVTWCAMSCLGFFSSLSLFCFSFYHYWWSG